MATPAKPSPSKPAAAKPPTPASPASAAPAKMNDDQIAAALKGVPEWGESNGSIQRTFAFADFVAAMRFVSEVAALAEQQHHHPDILIRYNKVTLTVNTHDAGGITSKDFTLAKAVDGVVKGKHV